MTWELRSGDCLDPMTGLASLGDKSVDHFITDPPYESEAHTLSRRTYTAPSAEYSKGGVGERPLGFDPITDDQRMGVAECAVRVARRWILIFCQVEAAMKWRDGVVQAGGAYKRSCVWVKPGASPQFTGDRPGMGYETIVACHAPGRSRWNAGGKHGVFEHPLDPHAGRVHQTQKPIGLMEALIRDFTDPGDIVVDPFAGSGTTGVACIRLGRRFIGWEKDPKFHAAALKRLEQTHEQPELVALESFRRNAKGKRKQTSLGLPDPEAA